MNAILILLGVMFLCGLGLVIRGLRGRVVGDHPYCRKCGYDLFGNPAAQRCSECGVDITQPSSRRIGLVERRRPLLITGVVLLCVTGLSLGLMSYHAIPWRIVCLRLTPFSSLEQRAFAGNALNESIYELRRRVQVGRLSARQRNQLADDVIARQADPNAEWGSLYGDVVERLHDANKLDDVRWQKYCRQSVRLVFTSNSRAAQVLRLRTA